MLDEWKMPDRPEPTQYTRDDLEHVSIIALGLACCHALATGDYHEYVANHFEKKYAKSMFDIPSVSLKQARSTSGIHTYHMTLMKKSMEICKRMGVKIADYREAMICVRNLSGADIVDLAFECEFFDELIPEELRVGLINHVMEI
jgi:hypothetical protein